MKKILISLCMFVLLASMIPAHASADGGYTSTGVFTTGITAGEKDPSCEDNAKVMEDWEKENKENTKVPELPKESEDDSDNKFLQIILGPIYRIIGDTFGSSEKEGVIKGGCDEEFSVTRHILKLTSPVKVTEFTPLMTFTKYIQNMAMGFLIVFIVLYGFQVTLGKKDLQDPIAFSFRMLTVILLITYAPRLIQDVLNLNNIIVYAISTLPMPSSGAGIATAGGAGLGLAGSLAIANFLAIFATTLISGVGLFVLIICLVLLVMILVPLLKIMLWWYVRLFIILLMTVFSPIFFMMFAAEETAKFAKNFFQTLLAEIFSQALFTLGFYFSVMLILNFDQFATTFDLGFIGLMLMLYVIIQMLSELPDMAKKWLGGSSTPGFKQISNMVSAGIGGAVGAAFDRSLKKSNEKQAIKGFNKSNDKQQSDINAALSNKDAWNTLNDTEEGRSEAIVANIKNEMNGQSTESKPPFDFTKPSNGSGSSKKTIEANQKASPSSNGSEQTGGSGKQKRNVVADLRKQVTKHEPVTPETTEGEKRSMADNAAMNMKATELSGYSKETQDSLIKGLKDGSLNRADALTMMENDRKKQGSNDYMATLRARDDANGLANHHGITFGAANDHLRTGNEMSLATPVREPGTFSQDAMEQVQSGMENGTMHRSQAVNTLANDLVANRGMDKQKASQVAENRMQKFEQANALGLGFEAQSQLNRLAKNGDLTQQGVRDIAKKDAQYHKGITDKFEVGKHVDSVMNKGDFENKVGVKSNRQNVHVQKAPSLNLGQGVRTSGGKIDRPQGVVGEPTGSNYEIPDQPAFFGGQPTAPEIDVPEDTEPIESLRADQPKKPKTNSDDKGGNADGNPALSGMISDPPISGHHTASEKRGTVDENIEQRVSPQDSIPREDTQEKSEGNEHTPTQVVDNPFTGAGTVPDNSSIDTQTYVEELAEAESKQAIHNDSEEPTPTNPKENRGGKQETVESTVMDTDPNPLGGSGIPSTNQPVEVTSETVAEGERTIPTGSDNTHQEAVTPTPKESERNPSENGSSENAAQKPPNKPIKENGAKPANPTGNNKKTNKNKPSGKDSKPNLDPPPNGKDTKPKPPR